MAEDTPTPSPCAGTHDDALSTLTVDELVVVCRWLGIDADPGAVRLGRSLPSLSRYPDLLVGAGDGRIAQIEFVSHPTADLPHRLLQDRARLLRREPGCRLRQHVVLLAGGRLEHELTDGEEYWCRFHVTVLRDLDPAGLLSAPALAPLACLGRLRHNEDRREVLRQALAVIHAGAAPGRAPRLAEVAAVLAAIRLDTDTVDSIARETSLPISHEGTRAGETIARSPDDLDR